MYFQKDFEVQGREVPGRLQTVPNWHQNYKDNAVSNIPVDAPIYHQRAACMHVGSSQNPLLNGVAMFPFIQENSCCNLQSSLAPNQPCIPAVDLSPNNYSVSQYNITIGTAASETAVAPPTPAAAGRNQYGKSKEYTLHENGNSKLQSFLVPNHLCKSAIGFSPNNHPVLQNNMVSCMPATKTVVAPPTPATNEKDQCGKLKDYIFREIIEMDSETSSNSLKQCVSNPVEPFQAVNHDTEAVKLLDVEGIQTVKQDIDLNRTPLQKPRRKKHRPKVIIEGKNAKTPTNINLKTAEQTSVKRKYVKKPKMDNVDRSTPTKRKYIRKKKEVNPLENPDSVSGEKSDIDPNNFCTNKSVKRSLNFDLNDTQASDLNAQVSEASESVKHVPRILSPLAEHSLTIDNANRSVSALEIPSLPQQLLRMEMVKKRPSEELASSGFNMKTRKEDENSNRVDKEFACMNIQRNKDKKMEEGQADLKGQKRDHKDVDDGWVHTNTSGTPYFHDILKKRRTEYEQHKNLSNSCSIPPHTPNSWRNVDNSQNSNNRSKTADKRKFPNHILAVNYVRKDPVEINLSNNWLSCPGNSYILDNADCSQPSTSEVLRENVNNGPRVHVKELIAPQIKAQTKRRRRREENQLVSSIAENAKRMELIIEYITRKLTCLNINDVCENVINEPHNALVPFVGGGMLVPFSNPLELMKKKKPRAKVNLDDESQRVWNLLMGKESDCGEGSDADKEKWWENERQVFLGRTESFTARMHLIQGDRKFSPWKGSVVDSVIGVFLTQNVSDHLSSSAFMSLAAKYPVKSNSSNATGSVEIPASPIVTKPNFYDQNSPGVSNSYQQDHRELSCSTESSFSDRGIGHESPDSVLSATVTSCAIRVEGAEDKIQSIEDVVSSPYSNSFTSFTQLLHMANNRALYTINATGKKNSDECGAGVDWPTLLRNNEVHVQDLSGSCPSKEPTLTNPKPLNNKRSTNKTTKSAAEKTTEYDWDSLRRQAFENGFSKERSCDAVDSLDYEALKNAHVSEISSAIRERGMNNLLAERIKGFLDRLEKDHGSIDLEWLRHVSPDKAKDYLLSIKGLGLKSVECIRLLTLHQLAFPVDTNVARISVRLGWVPLQPLPESLQLHLLEMYPVMETIQKYLWPRLCKLDQKKLYELHYQLITFGKVFCTKSKPNCNACPMRGECKHFASAYASARLALPGPEEKRIVNSNTPLFSKQNNEPVPNTLPHPQLMGPSDSQWNIIKPRNSEPIIEEPSTPEPEPECVETTVLDIEDDYYNDSDEIPIIKLNFQEFTQNLQNYMHENNLQLQDENLSNALVAISPEAASIPAPKLKNVNRLRTEHQVYELPDDHPLLEGMDNREPDDPCKYLLAIWTPGETAQSTEAPKSCDSYESGKMCGMDTCFSCNSIKEAQSQTVRGTILIPCRTANRGRFPLNGTYFQVNEVFADHDSSRFPIDVPRKWLWNLNRRTVYFGTSIPSIFKGLSTEDIQYCFWRGFVCVRGFDRSTRAPKPLYARLHFPASKATRTKRTEAAAKKAAEAAAAKKSAEAASAEIAEQKNSVPVEEFQSTQSPQTNENQLPINLIHID